MRKQSLSNDTRAHVYKPFVQSTYDKKKSEQIIYNVYIVLNSVIEKKLEKEKN